MNLNHSISLAKISLLLIRDSTNFTVTNRIAPFSLLQIKLLFCSYLYSVPTPNDAAVAATLSPEDLQTSNVENFFGSDDSSEGALLYELHHEKACLWGF